MFKRLLRFYFGSNKFFINNAIKFCLFTFLNMQIFFRNFSNEYPINKNEGETLSLRQKLLFTTTSPGFCIRKDIVLLSLIGAVDSLVKNREEYAKSSIDAMNLVFKFVTNPKDFIIGRSFN